MLHYILNIMHDTQVPPSVPSEKGLKSIHLKKAEPYVLEMRDPLPLGAVVESPSKVAAVVNNPTSSITDTATAPTIAAAQSSVQP